MHSKTPLTLSPQQAIATLLPNVLQVVWVCTVGINPLNVNIGFLRIAQVFCLWPHQRVGALVLVVWASYMLDLFPPTPANFIVSRTETATLFLYSVWYVLFIVRMIFSIFLIKGIINTLLSFLPLIFFNEIIYLK